MLLNLENHVTYKVVFEVDMKVIRHLRLSKSTVLTHCKHRSCDFGSFFVDTLCIFALCQQMLKLSKKFKDLYK